MRCTRTWGFATAVLLFLSTVLSTISAQSRAAEPARKILELTEDEQLQFIKAALDEGLPDNRADQMTMLVINRSALTLPLIEAKVEEVLRLQSPPQRFVATASELIAYAGNEQSLKAIAKLITLDEKRFSPLVGRALTHSANWRNPFTVAYRGLEMGDETISRYTLAWAESALASNRMKRAWAEAMLDRYGRPPSESEWTIDPIASRLKDRASPELRRSVSRLAIEAQTKRERQ